MTAPGLAQLWLFWIVCGVIGLALSVLAWWLQRGWGDRGRHIKRSARLCRKTHGGTGVPPVVGRDGRPTASIWRFPTEPNTRALATLLLLATAVRLVAVWGGPTHSNDIWRYIHDGAMLTSGRNPYAQDPDQLTSEQVPHHAIFNRINHRHLVTIYQPASQWVFAALWSLHIESLDPLGDRTFKLGFILLDLCVIAMIVWKLLDEGRSVWWAALYAWHPLAIIEIAHSGHQDVIGIFFLLATLILSQVGRITVPRALLAGIAFAAAVAVKPLVGPLALPLVWNLRKEPTRAGIWLTGAVLAATGFYLPFALMPGGLNGMWHTIKIFMDSWAFNGSIYPLLTAAIGSKTIVSTMLGCALLAILLVCMRRRLDIWHTSAIYLFAMLLFSSTAHTWYLLWALALAPLRFNWSLWVFSLTIVWSYAALLDMQAYSVPLWVQVIEYAPVYAILLLQTVTSLRRHPPKPSTQSGPTNTSARIVNCVA